MGLLAPQPCKASQTPHGPTLDARLTRARARAIRATMLAPAFALAGGAAASPPNPA